LRCIREEGLIIGASPQWHGSAGGGTAVVGRSDGRERWQLSRGAAGRRRGTHGGDDWIGGGTLSAGDKSLSVVDEADICCSWCLLD
jgi:hypothetical protein